MERAYYRTKAVCQYLPAVGCNQLLGLLGATTFLNIFVMTKNIR